MSGHLSAAGMATSLPKMQKQLQKAGGCGLAGGNAMQREKTQQQESNEKGWIRSMRIVLDRIRTRS